MNNFTNRASMLSDGTKSIPSGVRPPERTNCIHFAKSLADETTSPPPAQEFTPLDTDLKNHSQLVTHMFFLKLQTASLNQELRNLKKLFYIVIHYL